MLSIFLKCISITQVKILLCEARSYFILEDEDFFLKLKTSILVVKNERDISITKSPAVSNIPEFRNIRIPNNHKAIFVISKADALSFGKIYYYYITKDYD